MDEREQDDREKQPEQTNSHQAQDPVEVGSEDEGRQKDGERPSERASATEETQEALPQENAAATEERPAASLGRITVVQIAAEQANRRAEQRIVEQVRERSDEVEPLRTRSRSVNDASGFASLR